MNKKLKYRGIQYEIIILVLHIVYKTFVRYNEIKITCSHAIHCVVNEAALRGVFIILVIPYIPMIVNNLKKNLKR